MSVHHVNSAEEFDNILNTTPADRYVLVDFYADWCGPCKKIAPTLEKFASTFKSVTFLKVNIDDIGLLANRYNISSIPTFHVFKGGNNEPEYRPVMGADPKKIENMLKMITNPSPSAPNPSF
ncbi:thioredoxin [Fadolivirus algeromassiliense]|jgi:thioredoxin|uniref:Thioredoxin n=1 Tax=Fadolivirus FV1/VV64 TaxID=3070911 RepID=A0A7D3UQE2_9VIRU|nr:thioredoxin [Fadolivirus algeromassiliense]QKF93713.1 thioredoxin [Fadolivirus FV1/VV64]